MKRDAFSIRIHYVHLIYVTQRLGKNVRMFSHFQFVLRLAIVSCSFHEILALIIHVRQLSFEIDGINGTRFDVHLPAGLLPCSGGVLLFLHPLLLLCLLCRKAVWAIEANGQLRSMPL